MEKHYDEGDKQKYVRGFKNCNQTLLEYCDKMQIRYDDMKSWLKEYKNLPAFGKIDVKAIAEKESTTVQQKVEDAAPIKFETDTIKLELKPGYDKELLQQMMEVLVKC